MKKLLIYAIPALILIAIFFYVKTLFHNYGTIEANKVKIENGLILNEDGSPLSGIILGTVDHTDEMMQPFLELMTIQNDWVKTSFARRINFKQISAYKEQFNGFSVQANVKDGKLSDRANIYFDLRSAKEEVMGNPIKKNFKYYLGYLFKNQIKLAEANFENNQLNGKAFIYGLGSKKTFSKSIEINFKNNVAATIKRYHKNGIVKRINNFDNNIKDGLQQEFTKEGGKKVEEKSFYGKMNQIRKHFLITESNTIVEKYYYPNGELAKDNNGRDRKEWYSNGDLKLSVTSDTSIYNYPKGKVETYHNNGSVYTMYTYGDQGKLNGPYEKYYRSGKLWESGNYKNNKKEGNLKKWYRNGQVAEDHLMVSGKISGPFVRYYADGVKWKEFNYDSGLLTGKYKKWWKNGKLAFDCDYSNNRSTSCEKWNDKGEVIK